MMPLLIVGRLRKPHGLKGEVAVFPLTDDPGGVFRAGRVLTMVDLAGAELGEPLVIERTRPFHREWLVKFRGLDAREAFEGRRDVFLAAPRDTLQAPGQDEVYLHELTGFAVRTEQDEALGLVSGVYEAPAGLLIEVQGRKREFLLPYRKEFVVAVDRPGRRLVVRLPEGLLE